MVSESLADINTSAPLPSHGTALCKQFCVRPSIDIVCVAASPVYIIFRIQLTATWSWKRVSLAFDAHGLGVSRWYKSLEKSFTLLTQTLVLLMEVLVAATFASISVLATAYFLYRRLTRISISNLPGPASDSFLFGNQPLLSQGQASETEFKWQAEYGGVIRIKAAFGEDRLLISDPKALRYIYQTSGYNYPKQQERLFFTRLFNGEGLLWAHGDTHKRHRKVMLPGFGGREMKALVPIFYAHASKLATMWKDLIVGTDRSADVDIASWASRATLDSIGAAAFDYDFGAMDSIDNELAKAYSNLLAETFGSPSKKDFFMQSVIQYIPLKLSNFMADHIPNPRLYRVRRMSKVATSVAKSLVESKTEALLQGTGNRDIMSLLVQANISENERTKLSEDEILSQMRTILLAGHETTAVTLCWTLLELARHPDIQDKLRHEIRQTEQSVRARGESEFTSEEFDGMPYLVAVLKEVLRFHPVAYNIFRQAGRDDILPLSKPIITVSGETINHLAIYKGLNIVSSIAGYNRNKDIFGEDANLFNPERWLNGQMGKQETTVGVYGGLLTFAGGVRSCIGWRYAIQELHTFIVVLVNTLEFSLTPDSEKIRRGPCMIMVPTLEGQDGEGAQCPLKISVAPRE